MGTAMLETLIMLVIMQVLTQGSLTACTSFQAVRGPHFKLETLILVLVTCPHHTLMLGFHSRILFGG